MTKVQVLSRCEVCKGEAYLPIGEAISAAGEPYTRYQPCDYCNGSGNQPRWISLQEFARLLLQEQCQHTHTSSQGGFHFAQGEVWDNIQEVCSDCGATLDYQSSTDFV